MPAKITMNIVLDEVSRRSAKTERPFSTSQLIKWFMKLLATNDKEWLKLVKEDKEIKAVQDYIRPKLRKALMLDED